MRSNQRYTNEKKRASRNKGTLRQSKKSKRREYRAPVVTSFRRATDRASDAKRRKSKRTRARTSASNVRMSRARTRNRTYRSAALSSKVPKTGVNTSRPADPNNPKVKSILEELVEKPDIMHSMYTFIPTAQTATSGSHRRSDRRYNRRSH